MIWRHGIDYRLSTDFDDRSDEGEDCGAKVRTLDKIIQPPVVLSAFTPQSCAAGHPLGMPNVLCNICCVWGQFVGRLVKGPEVDFVKRRGGDLFMPIQNQNGDVLVMLAAEVSFGVGLL